MSVFSAKTLKKELFKEYKYTDLVVQDILGVISQYKDLKYAMNSYVFNDGSTRELMSLSGSIPVDYRGNVYNIPMCLWLMDSHPYNPPICFVKPTSTMLIKTGKHIDANGKIYLSYLHEWKHPQSDLYGLIQMMIVVFGEEPPVFSCPTTQNLYLAVASPRFPKCRDAASPVVDTESSTKGQQDSVEPAVSDNDQTEMVPDECGSWPILYTPSAVSAPEQLSASLASLTVSPVSEESALLRQKMELEIAVLQRQKKVLEIQEEYYSIKLRRLNE